MRLAASAYQKGEQIFIHPESKTTAGVWIFTPPVLVGSATNITQLGQYLTVALNDSKEGVSHPTVWRGRFDPVLRAADAKTENAFMNSVRYVSIECDGKYVSFIPSKNLGSKKGCVPISDKVHQILFGGPDELGRALLVALNNSEYQ